MQSHNTVSRSALQFALTAAVAVLGSVAISQHAFAADNKTRESVLAELAQARADSSMAKLASETEMAPPLKTFGGKSRAQVVAELVQARNEGMLASNNEADPFTTQNLAEARAQESARREAKAR